MFDLHAYLFIFLCWVIFLVCFNIFGKRLFHPVSLFTLLWASLLTSERILKFTLLDELEMLSVDTYMVVFFTVLFFSLGGLLSKFLFVETKDEIQVQNLTDRYPYLKNFGGTWISLFLLIGLIGLPLYIKSILSIQQQSANENFLVAIRSELIYGEMDIGPTKYLVAFSVVSLGLAFFLNSIFPTKKHRILFFIALSIALVYNLLYTGRTSIFLVLSVLLGVRSFFIRKNPVRTLFKLVLVFVLLFSILGILYEKGGSTDEEAGLNFSTTTEFAGLYLVGPIHGLNHYVVKEEKSDFSGEHTLNFFLRLGESIGLSRVNKTADIVESYVFMPYPTNVYTAFRVYLRDFGMGYLCLMFFFFGFIHSFIYEKAVRTLNIRHVLYYAFLLFPLLLSFFRDQYMTVFSSWLKIVLYIELFILLVASMPTILTHFQSSKKAND
jgi:oligosaccharide repeat unit polymerase